MPSAAEWSPSSPLASRRLLSRITSPFASKSRNVTDFSIEVDDPHKQYSPGDLVTGHVRLRVARPTRVTHLVVCLHGYVQVYKHPGSPGEGFRAASGYLGTGRGKKGGEYFGNGFASLFEDEVVLCGDGRLAEGTYQFNFELLFPDRDLPSSIDFERGTISYMITATLTRPTTMSPVMTCDSKVYFVERIDISPLDPPKPRTITLEPLSRRSRAKHQARKLVDPAERRSRKSDSATLSEQTRQSRTSSAPSTLTDGETPLSPVLSVVSLDSMRSSQRATSQPDTASRHSPSSSDLAKSSVSSRTITATVEPLTGGCLRGDYISVKVNISHTKPIRSLYGAIVTLYRQAHIDMHPAIPLGPMEKGVKDKYEDYYPKSLTGLGGLSLSGAGSSHVFRKDLAQVMVPVYVDPATLTAEVSAKVRVPEEAFPTISTVPGAMISFKYYIEVVIDIQGKLGGADRNMGNLGIVSGAPQMGERDATDNKPAFSAFGSTIVDTTPIRRDKSVVCCTFEVVVGTRDSERRKGKRKMDVSAEPEPPEPQPTLEQSATEHNTGVTSDAYHDYEHDGTYQDGEWNQQQHMHPPQQQAQYPYNYHQPAHYEGHYAEQPPPIPVPPLPDESELSEKERLRRAEERLLPSQPPGMNGPVHEDGQEATAPYIPGEVSDAQPGSSTASAAMHDQGAPRSPHEMQADHGTSAPQYQPRELSEKESIMRAEQRLLPSQPPGMDDLVYGDTQEATAPYMPEAGFDTQPAPSAPPATTLGKAVPHAPDEVRADHGQSAPEYEPRGHGGPARSTDHAQSADPERHQVLAGAEQMDGETGHAPNMQSFAAAGSSSGEPSASRTILAAYDSHADAAGSSDLPRYER